MILRLLAMVLAVGILGACAQQQPDEMAPPDAVPVVAVTTSIKSSFYDCSIQVIAANKRVGQRPEETHYFPVRVLAPNAVATTDHNLARLNIYVDGNGNILSAKCG